MKISNAVVLAGGPGIRLRPLTNDIPKAMITVCGKPLLEWVIEWLRDNEVEHIVLGVAYLKDKIMDHFGNGEDFGVNITYNVHTIDGGTCEGFRLAISRYVHTDAFFAMNGDQITNLNLGDLAKFHQNHNAIATMAVVHPRCPYGQVQFDEGGNATGFMEKPLCPHASCNTGIYVFNRKILSYFPEKGQVEETIFPLLAKERKLKIYPFQGFFTTVNTRKDLTEAERERAWTKRI